MKRRKDREMERQIRSILNQAEMEEGDWGRPEEGRKQETLAFLQAQRRKIRLRPRKSFAERLLDQASWLSPGVWLGQLAVPVLFCLLLGNEGLEKRDTLLVLSACAPLPGVIGLIELLRSWQSGMWELEEACRYHLQQIQGMRLLVLGITDSAGTAVVFAAGLLNGYRAGMLLLFFLFPLLVSDSVFLLLAGVFRRGAKGLVPELAGLGMGIFWIYQASWLLDVLDMLHVLESYRSLPVLAALLFGGLGLLAFACARFLNETGKEEQRLWNCA